MKKQYLVKVKHKYQASGNEWSVVVDGATFYQTMEEAHAALRRYISKHNKARDYGPDGKRRETRIIGGNVIEEITDKKADDDARVVAWQIKVREVSEWEFVDGETL